MCKYKKNKTKVNFADVNLSVLNKSVRSHKKSTAFSVKGSSQICVSTKIDVLWEILGNQKVI